MNSRFLIGMLALVIAVPLLTLIFWPINALVRRHYGKKLNLTQSERRLRFWSRMVCVLIVLFLAGYTMFIAEGFESVSIFSSKMDGWLRLLQFVGLLGALGGLICLFYVFRTWSNPEGSSGQGFMHCSFYWPASDLSGSLFRENS